MLGICVYDETTLNIDLQVVDLTYSPDPPKNSKTTNPECSWIVQQIRLFLTEKTANTRKKNVKLILIGQKIRENSELRNWLMDPVNNIYLVLDI